MEFEEVDYWPEICKIMDWSTSHVYSTFHICWGAQAALIIITDTKEETAGKDVRRFQPQGDPQRFYSFPRFDDTFMVPHSRHTTVLKEDILKVPSLKILAESEEAGVYAISTDEGRRIFITGHSEYDTDTLAQEYFRDKEAGLEIKVPKNCFPEDDDSRQPSCCWRSGANLLYSNWLNYLYISLHLMI